MAELLGSGMVRAVKIFELLVRAGWRHDRISGSHHIFTKDGSSCLPIAVHGGKLRRDVVRHVLRAAALADEDVQDGADQPPSTREAWTEVAASASEGSDKLPPAKPWRPLESEKWAEISTEEREAYAKREAQQEEARCAARAPLLAAVSAAELAMVVGDLVEAERLLSPLLPAAEDVQHLDETCEILGYELAGDALFFYTQAVVRLATADEAALAAEAHRPRLVHAVRLCKAVSSRFVEHRETMHELLEALLSRVYGSYVDALCLQLTNVALASQGVGSMEEFHAAGLGKIATPHWSKQGEDVDTANDGLRSCFAFIMRLARDEQLPQLSVEVAPVLGQGVGQVVAWVSRAAIIHLERGYVAEACELFESLDVFVKQHAKMITRHDEEMNAVLPSILQDTVMHGVRAISANSVAQVRGLACAALSMRPAIEHACTKLHWVPIIGFEKPDRPAEHWSVSAGCRVTLSGLSKDELNGLQGRAVRRLPDTGRWQVVLDTPTGDAKSLSLKAENLVAAATTEPTGRGWASVLDAAERLGCSKRPLPDLDEQMKLFFQVSTAPAPWLHKSRRFTS